MVSRLEIHYKNFMRLREQDEMLMFEEIFERKNHAKKRKKLRDEISKVAKVMNREIEKIAARQHSKKERMKNSGE